MQVPIVSGIYAGANAEFRTSYPVNMVPTPKTTGINAGYLRCADGIVQHGTGGGACRGGIEWDGVIYRVLGSDLVSEDSDGNVTIIGDVAGSGDVSMAYSFDYLAVVTGGRLWLYDGTTLAQNTDDDLGLVIDVEWVDGYFMLTDGEFLIVTELSDPFEVNPFKYGSSEVDPDAVVAVVKLRNEILAVNRYSIETFQNQGGSGFPFVRANGAQIHRGAVGTHACVEYMSTVAFVGSGHNESPAVWMGANGQSTKVSTTEIDLILQEYTEAELSKTLMEVQTDRGHNTLIIHLPRHTMLFDAAASQESGSPVWYFLSTSTDGTGRWDARHIVWAYDRWNVGSASTTALGQLTRDVASHWGEVVTWQFGCPIIYNEGRGLQFHEVELVCLTGSTPIGKDPVISTEYSKDGVVWSQPKTRRAGKTGERTQRLRWTRQGSMSNFRMQRFIGSSDAPIAPARLEIRVEPLAW